MRWFPFLALVALLGCSTASGPGSGGGGARIIKVLPHYLDHEGRHTHAPSLYERDAYQYLLRQKPELQNGLAFHVMWKAPPTDPLTLRIDLQGNLENKFTAKSVQSDAVRHAGGREWMELSLSGEELRALGKLIAWKATLWNGTNLLAQQQSYLW